MAAVRRVHDELRMPPTEALRDSEIAGRQEWIAGGATWPTSDVSVDASAEVAG